MGQRSKSKRLRVPLLLDALARSEQAPRVRELMAAFGGDPVETVERKIGVPAVHSTHLRFASGGEIVLHDDTVVAVILHLAPTPFSPEALDLRDWIPGVDNRSGLDAFKAVFGQTWRFAGGGMRYFPVLDGYVRLTVQASELINVVFFAEDPKLVCAPEDEECETCGELPVRRSDGGLDVDATIKGLMEAVAERRLREESSRPPLVDLQQLHASGLLKAVEGQALCRTCSRVLCLTLYRDGAPTLAYVPYDAAMRRPQEDIPPVSEWGDAARIAVDRSAMHYVDHEPGCWFLVEQRGEPHLDARYSAGPYIDSSVLIRLDADELAEYRLRGREFLSELAHRIERSAPWTDDSPYRARDLYRADRGADARAAVSAAIINHTWIAEQRR